MRVAPEQLTKSLEGQGIRLDTLKNHIKADMARASLARLRYHKFQD
jgi:peptidyl-prolyl cis-trans isomerase SurA